jgi:hypothetical protein
MNKNLLKVDRAHGSLSRRRFVQGVLSAGALAAVAARNSLAIAEVPKDEVPQQVPALQYLRRQYWRASNNSASL